MEDETAAVDVNSIITGYLPGGVSDPAFHFDGCAFVQGAATINSTYRDFLDLFADEDAFVDDDLAEYFGIVLHPVQDFYSHTNWVEYVRAGVISRDALAESGLGFWQPLVPYSEIQPNVLLVQGEEFTPLVSGYGQVTSMVRGANFDVSITFADGRVMKGLISGDFDDPFFTEPNYSPDNIAASHNDVNDVFGSGLNKDRPDRNGFFEARELATRQTFHEFKRLVNLVKERYGEEGVDRLLCEWVKPEHLVTVNRFLGREPGVTEVTVIDQSGSMDGSPLEQAISSASAAVGTRNEGDRIGVVAFSSSASVLFPLTTITSGSNVREQAQQAIAGLTAGGSTSIGAGLLAAVNMLDPDDDCGPTSIVVLTDGEENTEPYIADVQGQIPKHVTVHGIALGSGADAPTVQKLARDRGGQFFAATDESDLPAVYARVSGAVSGEQDVARQRGVIGRGERRSMPFVVDGTSGALTVGVTWPGSDLDLTVIAPDGTTYTRSGAGGGRFTVNGTSEFFRLAGAMAGTWLAVVDAVDVADGGEKFEVFARVASPLAAEILTASQTVAAGDSLTFRVRLTNGLPVAGASVIAALLPPNPEAVARRVRLFDDGTHGDETANDGVYSNTAVVGELGGGVYTLQITATGNGFVRSPSQLLLVSGSRPPATGLLLAAGAGQGGGPRVTAFDADGSVRFSFYAFDPSFTGGVNVATGDVTGDGVDDIVCGAGLGGGPHVKVFDGTTGAVVSEWFAYAPFFNGGVLVAVADFDLDGRAEVITGAGFGGGPSVRVFGGLSGTIVSEWFAYDPNFRGGVTVAADDINGDSFADVVTGAGATGGPHVKVFDGTTGAVVSEWFAYSAAFTGGVYVAAGDFDADGRAEVLTGTGAGGGPVVRVFDGLTGGGRREFAAADPDTRGGTPVTAGDFNGDGVIDLVAASGVGLEPEVNLFNWRTGLVIDALAPFESRFTGGVFVG